jgi:hypothetical protein
VKGFLGIVEFLINCGADLTLADKVNLARFAHFYIRSLKATEILQDGKVPAKFCKDTATRLAVEVGPYQCILDLILIQQET